MITRKGGAWLLASMICAAPLSGCSDDEAFDGAAGGTPLPAPQVVSSDITPTSLFFSWEAVEGTTQYSYQLYDPDNHKVTGDVTTKTSVRIDKLRPMTTYTLKVIAYSPLLDPAAANSPIAEITATTCAVIPLATPTQLVATPDGSTIQVEWAEVENATSYEYYYSDGTEETAPATTSSPRVTLRGVPNGEFTFYVKAASDAVYEATGEAVYSDSEYASTAFVRSRVETWRAEGTYQSGSGGYNYAATLIAYDDNSYTVKNWQEVEGYDLEFAVEEDGSVTIANGKQDDKSGTQYTGVATGMDYEGFETFYISIDSEKTVFTGSEKRGELCLYGSFDMDYFYYDTFWWGEKAVSWTADGTFTQGDSAETWTATLTAYTDGSYALKNWFGVEGYDFCFTPDADGTLNSVQRTTYRWNEGGTWYGVPTGTVDSEGYNVTYYAGSEGFSFSGDQNGGKITMKEYYATENDLFTWGAASEVKPTIDDLVGTYSAHHTGQDYAIIDYNAADWAAFDLTNDVEVKKVDDTHISILDPLWNYYELIGEVDMEQMTITFDHTTPFDGYTFCAYDAPGTPVVATIDENLTIQMSDWTYYYADFSYSYVYEAVTEMTKK